MQADTQGRLRSARPLFIQAPPELAAALEDYRRVLHTAHPLKTKHGAGLPNDVKRLSLALTAERGPGPQANYLSSPANLSAYLYYFLPWNIYRVSRLLHGLALDLPEGSSVLDLGCGPLTLVQALWIARPQLRTRRLRFVCLDQTGSVMRAGKALFEALAGEAGQAWSIELVQGPLHKAPQGPFQLVTALNALNELAGGRGEEGRDALDRVAEALTGRLAADGRLLLVEPGTRLGGGLLSRLREALMEEGLFPQAPCTHDAPCPMLAPRWRSWCHFTFPAEGIPAWLARLSDYADLEKDRVSLAFLLMSGEQPEYKDVNSRVVSHRFALPGGQGVYACAEDGIRLMTFVQPPRGLLSGALVEAELPESPMRDPKTGAWVCPLVAAAPGEARGQQPSEMPGGPAREAAAQQPKSQTGERKPHGAGAPGRPARPGRPGPAKSGPAKSGPAKSGPAKAGPGKAGPAKSDPAKAGPGKAGPAKSGPARAGSGRPKGSRGQRGK